MNNEIGRKITSLTLMTIMLAGGMVIAAPSMMPAAHAANANLFVSAENSLYNNYFGGAQVIEIVINDADIKETDESKGEPDVTVNGKIVRMTQGVDGLWYAYITDLNTSVVADGNQAEGDGVTPGSDGAGLDFGLLCDRDSAVLNDESVVTVTDTVGIWIPFDSAGGEGVNGNDIGALASCTDAAPAGTLLNNVVREAKDISDSNPNDVANIGDDGQIGIDPGFWPFIQTYDFNPTGNVIVQYNKGSNVQTTSLTFDTLDGYIDTAFDRSSFPPGAQVHLTISDMELNFDPTDEDSITFTTDGSETRYQAFDESGNNAGACAGFAAGTDCIDGGFDGTISVDIVPILDDLLFEDGGILILDVDAQDALDNTVVPAVADDETTTDDVLVVDGNTDSQFNAFDTQTFVTITELGPNSGVFATYDEQDDSVLSINSEAVRGTSAIVDYDDTGYTILVANDFASIDIQPIDDEWSSGEEIPVVLMDDDLNLNSRFDEDLDLNDPGVPLIPSVSFGSPTTMASATSVELGAGNPVMDSDVQSFSDRAMLSSTTDVLVATGDTLVITFGTIEDDLLSVIPLDDDDFQGFGVLNYDIRSLANDGNLDDLGSVDINISGYGIGIPAFEGLDLQGTITLDDDDVEAIALLPNPLRVTFTLDNAAPGQIDADTVVPIVVDFFGFGFFNDGTLASERVDNMIVRLELEESGDNTGEFIGSLEYVMLNQLNILDVDTYTGLGTIADDPALIVIEDFTDEDSIRVDYNDLGADGVTTPVGDQEEAPSHSGVVSFDLDTYKVADTVAITLEDADLNVDSDLIEIYTIVTRDVDGTTLTSNDAPAISADGDGLDFAVETVGEAGLGEFSFGPLGSLLNITFDDQIWAGQDIAISGVDCATLDYESFNDGFGSTGFTLIETDTDSGEFTGDFQIPNNYCNRSTSSGSEASTTGTDIEVNYLDFRDASGEIIEVGDSAGIRANTGSVSLDRTVYPVPWGSLADFGDALTTNTPSGASIFPVHVTGVSGDLDDLDGATAVRETLGNGDLTIHIRVNDPDFDISAAGSDVIETDNTSADPRGPVKITVSRGSDEVVLAYAGGSTTQTDGVIDVGDDGIVFDNDLDGAARTLSFAVDAGLTAAADGAGDTDTNVPELLAEDQEVRLLGAIDEIAPDAGIFELDFNIRYTDGPASSVCPDTETYEALNGGAGAVTDRFSVAPSSGEDYCILQGDIITVEYTDPTDAAGDPNTVTDSATFDLRNGVLQSDKSVYIIGGDMILTIIEPDWDLDNDAAETYDLDIIEWDSDAATLSMGNLGGDASNGGLAFDPEPTDFRETGDSTGIFQIVIEIPEELDGDRLERGEEIVLEYTDWGPSGSDFVGQEDEDINVTVFTSNFGATVELDQKVYSWTDKVYITVVAPDHNFDGDLIDEVGGSSLDPIKVSTRGHDINEYKLVETGTDTGIFTGEVILTGFQHDADGDANTGDASGFDTNPTNSADNSGPTDGFLQTDDDDGLTVSFEFSEDETVVGSALIRWNIGEVQWLEASYPASGTGVVRIIDPDMNLNPESVDNFDVDVWSDSDAGGIDLTVTETNEATGIFEGTVFFTVADESSGHRLRVAEGDTVTAEYEDNTLPDPYTTADELDITATTLIGTVVPPLERAPAASLRTVDAFGNSLDAVSVDQQVQISADLANGQDREQSFAYLVQIQDGNGVTVSLAWITGSLSEGQSFSPALSWIPTQAGTYTATAFVWESVDNPTALSPPVSTTITVQ